MEFKLTTNQLKRMPTYLDLLRKLSSNGVKYISCQTIADCLSLNKEQVRKDIALVSSIDGIPNKGRNIDLLIKDIEIVLGLDNGNKAILIGVGSLGTALLKYNGFKNYGLKIVGAFDKNKALVGKKINDIEIYDLEKLRNVIEANNAHIGILTVPSEVAQSVTEMMIENGIEAIWNFAPANLTLNENIIVSNMDMAQSLATLSHKLYIKNMKG